MKNIGWRAAAALCLLGSLVACGGGGGGSSSSTPAPAVPAPATPPTSLACTNGAAVVRAEGALVGKQAAAGVLGCAGPLTQVQWTQSSGPAVKLLSAHTQLIHFEPTEAGSYGFRVQYTDAGGVARSQDVTVTVTAPTDPLRALVRNHQAVRMGGNVSLRAWSANADADALQSVTWEQLEGPRVTLRDVDSQAKQFVAPTVARDSLLRFKATVTTSAGSDSQEVLVLVEQFAQAPDGDGRFVFSDEHVSRVHAYRANSPYAADLVACTYDPGLSFSTACTLGRLPLLGQQTAGALPTVEQVMARVLVSHDWQGANFERFLLTHDTRGDFRRMLMSTTAVVIGAHVRPSFYHPATAAIYLDADNFWLTPEERDTIDEAPDFRSGFGSELAYVDLWRYVKNKQRYPAAFEPQQRVTRSLDDLLADAGWLMYHELTHAADFFPPRLYAGLSPSQLPFSLSSERFQNGQLVSDDLRARYPLRSQELQGLGAVSYRGATATATQRAYTADQVAAFFAADLATDTYAYSTPREDLAMTIEEALMSLRLGVQRDVAFMALTTTGVQVNDVRWGQRGRIGEPALRARLQLGAAQAVPWMAAADFNALPAPLPMRVGQSWTANLDLGPFAASVARARALSGADLRREALEGARLARLQRERAAAHETVERWLHR